MTLLTEKSYIGHWSLRLTSVGWNFWEEGGIPTAYALKGRGGREGSQAWAIA